LCTGPLTESDPVHSHVRLSQNSESDPAVLLNRVDPVLIRNNAANELFDVKKSVVRIEGLQTHTFTYGFSVSVLDAELFDVDSLVDDR
jgi:hypothetical protein